MGLLAGVSMSGVSMCQKPDALLPAMANDSGL